MKVNYYAFTDVGAVRRINQDSYVVKCDRKRNLYLFAVADGLGGLSHGERASAAIIARLREWMERMEFEYISEMSAMAESLKHAILCANKDIYDIYGKCGACGSTLVLLCIWQDAYIVIAVGDSRIYRYGSSGFAQITRDDVWELQQEVSQAYTQQEIKRHSGYGKLVTAVGVFPDLSITYNIDILDKRSNFLLCSDGIYKYCTEKDIKRCISRIGFGSEKNKLQRLKRHVFANGMGDNATAILVMCKA